jgi:hypothetical protein
MPGGGSVGGYGSSKHNVLFSMWDVPGRERVFTLSAAPDNRLPLQLFEQVPGLRPRNPACLPSYNGF